MNISPVTYPGYTSGFTLNPSSETRQDTRVSDPANTQTYPTAQETQAQGNTQKEQPNSTNQADSNDNSEKSTPYSGETKTVNGEELDQNDLKLIETLKKTDAEVRRHEMAHIAAGGQYITSSANFTYKKGPDGVQYAVGGEVGIDTSPVPGDPEATIRKMKQVKNAALAPADPSPQDLRVASKATSAASKALSEFMMQQVEERAEKDEEKAFGTLKDAAGSYEKVNGLPESDTHSFEIAV